MLNLKPRFGPKVCGEPKRVKLETQIRAMQRFVESQSVLNLKLDSGQRFVESQSVLSLKPRFGPKVCGEPKRVKLETQIRAKGLWRAKAC